MTLSPLTGVNTLEAPRVELCHSSNMTVRLLSLVRLKYDNDEYFLKIPYQQNFEAALDLQAEVKI